MKLKLIYLLSFFCLLMAGCSDDDPALVLSQTEFKEIASEGGVCKIEISTANEWTATSDNDWCKVSKEEGVLSHTLVVDVEGNLGETRTGQVTVSSLGVDYVITISQQGLEEGKELKYRIPIVFHVIYADEKDSTQNIPASTIYAMLDDVNQMYRNAGGTNTVDLNMEFVLAETDPQGNLLKEPGIDRVKWLTAELDPADVMEDNTRKYVHFLWEPNDYVNVLIYRFTANNILGISTFPYTTASHPMDGTDVLPDINISLANLTYVRGVSINSSFVGNVDDALTPYAPENYKEIITKQVDDGITLAHELGHYFGLRHAFSEANVGCLDTDFCGDTPSYNYQDYTMFVQGIYQHAWIQTSAETRRATTIRTTPCLYKASTSRWARKVMPPASTGRASSSVRTAVPAKSSLRTTSWTMPTAIWMSLRPTSVCAFATCWTTAP